MINCSELINQLISEKKRDFLYSVLLASTKGHVKVFCSLQEVRILFIVWVWVTVGVLIIVILVASRYVVAFVLVVIDSVMVLNSVVMLHDVVVLDSVMVLNDTLVDDWVALDNLILINVLDLANMMVHVMVVLLVVWVNLFDENVMGEVMEGLTLDVVLLDHVIAMVVVMLGHRC